MLILARLTLFAVLWTVLSGPDPTSWIIGVPAVALATVAATRLAPRQPGRPRLAGLIRFVPFFLLESLRGGLDVALRVMRPVLRINPGLRGYPLRLKNPQAQVFFLNIVSLLPGTLSADLRNGILQVHALDVDDAIEPSLMRLEARVADLFGEDALFQPPLQTPHHD